VEEYAVRGYHRVNFSSALFGTSLPSREALTMTKFISLTLVSLNLCLIATVNAGELSGENWPMAAGPAGSWTAPGTAPAIWSVAANENIRWRTTLPEGGQSGIAVWGDRLFLTINKPLPLNTKSAKGADIVGYCLDANTGRVFWTVPLPGERVMEHTGLFSDATTPTPLADASHVWFTNASGMMGCWDHAGKTIWTRTIETRTRHNAKQCEPMLVGDWILHVEMRDADDPKRRPMTAKKGARNSPPGGWPWTFVRAFDRKTGKPVWTADAGTSVHNTPRHGLVDGRPVVFHARGGGHRPPETPYGFSLTSLAADSAGKTLWDYPSPAGIAYVVSHFDDQYAYCFEPGELVMLDIKTGKPHKRISLNQDVDVRTFDEASGEYSLHRNVKFPLRKGGRSKPHPTNQTNLIYQGYCYFMSYSGHSIGRAKIKTGEVEYLQVPVQVDRKEGQPAQWLWNKHIPSDTQNSRGMHIAPDKRAKGDGWGHVTSASPIAIGKRIYFTTMIGTTYVLDAHADVWDKRALLSVNDLGPAGKTWSLSGLSYAQGRLFQRSLKEVVCIGKADGKAAK
jgi:hypothetical protein